MNVKIIFAGFLAFLAGLVVDGLQCFSCYAQMNTDIEKCLYNFTNYGPQICTSSQYYCKVEKIEISGQIQKFFRGCVDQCRPVCKGVKGTGQCVSCCSTDLCNKGSGSSSVTSRPLYVLSTALFTTLLLTIFSRSCRLTS